MRAIFRQPYFITSLLIHVILLMMLMVGLQFSSPTIVFENTNKQDVISAVVLGDSQESKLIKEPLHTLLAPEQQEKPLPKRVVDLPKQDAIAIHTEKHKTTKENLKRQSTAHPEQLKKKKLKPLKRKLNTISHSNILHQQIEKTMRQALLDEDIKFNTQLSREASGIVNRYQALITQAISEHWIIPPGANKKLSSILLIRLAKDGSVLEVSVVQSSGDPALDDSARRAVYQASPLPVPPDTKAFDSFKQFRLTVRPETMIDNPTTIAS